MPQWDFLNFMAEHGRRYSGFKLRTRAEVTDLIEENGRIVGLKANTPDGPLEVRADLIVGADGRHSVVRSRAGLQIDEFGTPIDVLWMRLTRQAGDPSQPLGRFNQGKVFVMIDRGDYWQCAYVIPKGGFETIQQRGLEAFREAIVQIAPFMKDRVGELQSWDAVKLLTVKVDRLRRWYRPGLLCIGDAAHAMSPIGGVGINLAIQDAVAAANILVPFLRKGTVTTKVLARVQARRELPTRLTQRIQRLVQDRMIHRVLTSEKQLSLPFGLKLIRRFPFLRRILARLVGLGIRPEHVRTPELASSAHG
jgi:2-polyprenyl-6-methoxyphenol hydroxylase-like FAD-dependent oxidoreductase